MGHHVAKELLTHGHDVVLISTSKDTSPLQQTYRNRVRVERIGVSDPVVLAETFEGCDAVVHCAGINREVGDQTYQAVHVDGTHWVVEACKAAGVPKLSRSS